MIRSTAYLSVLYLGVSDLSQFALGMGNDIEAVYNKEGAVHGQKRAPCNSTDRFGPTRRARATTKLIGICCVLWGQCGRGETWEK
jgi:hypothetical protein